MSFWQQLKAIVRMIAEEHIDRHWRKDGESYAQAMARQQREDEEQ